MSIVDLLRELQAVDSSLETDRTSLARIEAELGDRSHVESLRVERESRAVTLRRVESDQRDLELEVEKLRGHLQDIERKLYGGRVGDAKELTNLNREAGQFRGLISTREDRLLGIFESADEASGALRAAEQALREAVETRTAREHQLAAERDRLAGTIRTEEATREALRGQADAAAVRTYDNLRRSRGGLAVAEVRQRTCQGCRVSLPSSLEQRARHADTLVFCQSCGRILYAAV